LTNLPDEHHFAKQISGLHGGNFSDEDDGFHMPPWLHRSAFAPRKSDPSVSGLWLERVDGSFRAYPVDADTRYI